MAAGAVLFWPKVVPPFDPEKTLAFCSALAVWIFIELFPDQAGEKSEAQRDSTKLLTDHDIGLANRIYGLMGDDQVRFLKEHDFGGSFHDDEVKPIYELVHILGNVTSEFNNDSVQEKVLPVKEVARKLASSLSLAAYPKNARSSRFTIIPEREPDGLWSEQTVNKVKEINELADSLAEAIETLYRELRKQGFAFLEP